MGRSGRGWVARAADCAGVEAVDAGAGPARCRVCSLQPSSLLSLLLAAEQLLSLDPGELPLAPEASYLLLRTHQPYHTQYRACGLAIPLAQNGYGANVSPSRNPSATSTPSTCAGKPTSLSVASPHNSRSFLVAAKVKLGWACTPPSASSNIVSTSLNSSWTAATM